MNYLGMLKRVDHFASSMHETCLSKISLGFKKKSQLVNIVDIFQKRLAGGTEMKRNSFAS